MFTAATIPVALARGGVAYCGAMRQRARTVLLRLLSWLMGRSLPRRIAAAQHTNPLVRAIWGRASHALRWRPVPILSGPGCGLRINLHGSAVAFATGTAERPLQEALRRELAPGMTFFDIGANVGFVTLIAAWSRSSRCPRTSRRSARTSR